MSNEINVKFFAALRETLNSDGLSNPHNVSITTIADVKQALIANKPDWQAPLASNSLLMAVNHEMVQSDHLVKAGDEVAFFPPVTGG